MTNVMKKLFSMLFIAAMCCMALVSCGNDEPSKTPSPKISFEVLDNEVIVTAVGQGEVLLYQDEIPTTNPALVSRTYSTYSVKFTATAQEEGKTISDIATLVVEIPSSKAFSLSSVYENPTDTHFRFDIDMEKDSSSIYLYNIVFQIGDAVSPAMNIRIDAPVTIDKTGKIYTYAGTGIMPYMMRGNTLVPMTGDAYLVTNLLCNVNTEAKTYDIKFDCHGGNFVDAGRLK